MSKARKLNDEKTDFVSDKALIYCRVSSPRQKEEGHGLESQEQRCREYAAAHKYEVVSVFGDSFTGAGDFMARPAMRALIQFLDDNPHTNYVVIFDDLKRFARDVEFHLKLRTELRRRSVVPKCLNFNFEDTPEGNYVETILAAGAELERTQNRRQVVQKQKARLELGYWAFGAKRGYEQLPDPVHGKLCVPKEPDASLIKFAVESYASGSFVTKVDACRYLVEKGFWKKQSPEKYISKFSEMIESVFLAGYVEYPAWGVSLREGKHEGLVSLEVLRTAQRRSRGEYLGKRVRIDKRDDFPLRGLLKCEECGEHITAYWTTSKGNRYAYYECKTKNCPCRGKTIPKKYVENGFAKLLKDMSVSDEIIAMLKYSFDNAWEDEIALIEDELKKKKKRVSVLERKAEELSELVISASSERLRVVYEKQLEKVAAELEVLEENNDSEYDLSVPYRNALDKASGLLKSPYKIWTSVDAQEKHRLFFFLFDEKLPYSKKAGYRNDNLPCAVRVFEEFATTNSQDVEMGRIELPSELAS